jgi:hypothetical protein
MRFDLYDRRGPDPAKSRLRKEVSRMRRTVRALIETLEFARDCADHPRVKEELEAAIAVGRGLHQA